MTPTEQASIERSPAQNDLEQARVRQLYLQRGAGTLAAIMATGLVTMLLWDSSPKGLLVIWASVRIGLFLAQEKLAQAYEYASSEQKSDPVWGQRFSRLAIFSGISWGSSALVICNTSSALDQAITLVFVCAAVTGAVALYAPMRKVYTGFILASMVPIAVCLASKGAAEYLTLSGLALIYMGVMFVVASRLEDFHNESFRLRYENRDLIEYLDREKSKAEALNQELQFEIHARSKVEKELRRARDELETRVSERTSELIEINEELGWEIIERKGIEEKLRVGEQKYRTLVENVNSLIIRINTKGRLTFLNEYAARFFGYSVEEAMGAHVLDLIIPARDSEGRDMSGLVNDILTEPELHETVEIENVRRDGDRAWVSWTIKGLRNGDGRITEIQCVGNDITRLKQAEDALKRSEQRFKELYGQSERAARLHKALLDYSPDPIAVYDIEGRAIYINSAFTKMFGWGLDEVSGKKIDFVPEESEKETEEMIKQALEGREFSDLTTKRLTKDGDIIDVSISGALYGDELGNPSGGIVHFRDIREKKRAQAALKKAHDELDQRVKERTEELAQTNARLQEEIRERQRIEEALRYQASHDYLTGLWNRKTTMEALERELSRCERENADAGVVMIDVDHFKDVNDSAGHLAGDFVLKQVADRIKDQLRVYDWLGRYGGEEFLIILPGANKAQAVNVSERIRRTIAQTPIQIDGGVVSVTISLGVTTVREMEQIKVDTAIRNADTALYLAKENGRNRVEFYDSTAALQ